MSGPIIVAIDGPSGSGKSTVSRALAKELGWSYLDTGSMYRAMTWYIQSLNVDLADGEAVAQAASGATIRPSTDPLLPGIWVGETDVSEPIRGPEVTGGVSAVSAVPSVRSILVELQREIANTATAGIVVEGRDIGSVVLPEASLKLFITADPAARAARRAAEVGGDIVQTQESLQKRDYADSTRATSPLEMAADAILIDTTQMQLAEVIDHVLALAKEI
jgi:cytidylate kinase